MNSAPRQAINSDYQSAYRPAPAPRAGGGEDRLDAPRLAEGRMVALARARRLPWDTERLGIPCGRLEQLWAEGKARMPMLIEALDEVIGRFDREGIQLVDARVGLHDLSFAQALEGRGFFLTDVMAIYGSAAAPAPMAAPEGYRVAEEPGGPEALDEAASFTLSAFSHSRLYHDSRIDKRAADDFYLALLRHFFTAPDTTLVLARGPEGRVTGYALGRLGEDPLPGTDALAYLWMIAVDPAHTGKGLGRVLLNEFLRAMHQRAPFVEIGTQVFNGPAIRLYQRANLPVAAHLATFHRWAPR